MGTGYDGSCQYCGYKARVTEGCGMAMICVEIFVCGACNDFVSAVTSQFDQDLKEFILVPANCQVCGGSDMTKVEIVFRNRKEEASFGENSEPTLCPKCGKPEFRFIKSLIWD